LSSFIQGVRPLQLLLEKEFSLCQNGFSLTEVRHMDIRKREWFIDRLLKMVRDEQQADEDNARRRIRS